MKQFIRKAGAWFLAAGCAVLFTGCASTSTDSKTIALLPWHRTAPVDHAGLQPALPPAGSGRGAYFQDDGPGVNPPPELFLVPDAVFKDEPIAKVGNRPYSVFGQKYTPLLGNEPYSQQGIASWYGVKFHGHRTSSGERYDMYKMTAAHPTLPIPSYVRVTSLQTGKQVVVRINDRGPFLPGRMIDVSYTAAMKLGLLKQGRAHVRIDRILAADAAKVVALRREAPVDTKRAPRQANTEF
jgi:rare lipoprotein A